MKKLYIFLITIFIIIVMILSCSKWDLERIEFTQVITVGVIEVGASSAFLIGDIEGLRGGDVTETGFVYSSTAKNESTLQLGNNDVSSKISVRSDTTADRAFAVRVDGLEPNTSFSFRAYIKLSGIQEAIYGSIDSFSTGGASLSLLSISRSNPGCPTTVTIEIQVEQSGSSGETTFGLIWSDSEENDQPTFQNGSFVTGTPDANGVIKLELELECDKVYFVRGGALLAGGIPVLSDVSVVTVNPLGFWVKRSRFPSSSEEKPFAIAYEGTGIIFRHSINSGEYSRFDPKINEWLAGITAIRGYRSNSFGIIINGQIVGGFGQLDPTQCPGEPYDCDSCETWTLNTPGLFLRAAFNNSSIGLGYGEPRRNPIGLVIGQDGYFGGGDNFQGCEDFIISQGNYKDFVKMIIDFTNRTIEYQIKDDIPPGIGRTSPTGFSIGGYGYVGFGFNSLGNPLPDFYRFDPSQPSGSQWQAATDFPGNYQYKGPGFTLKDKGYVIATDDRNSTKELWQFDVSEDPMGVWNRMPDLPASPGGLVQAHFVIDNNAYVYLDSIPDNFWMYVPSLLVE